MLVCMRHFWNWLSEEIATSETEVAISSVLELSTGCRQLRTAFTIAVPEGAGLRPTIVPPSQFIGDRRACRRPAI